MKYLLIILAVLSAAFIAPPPPPPVEQDRLAHQLAIAALYRLHDCRSEAVTRDCSGCHL